MNNIVEKLPCEVSQMDGKGVGSGLQFINKMHKGRLGIGFKTTGYGGDVYKKIGLQNNQFGHVNLSTLIHAHTNKVQLGALPQDGLQIRPLGLSV